MNRNANLTPSSFPFMREDFHKKDSRSSDVDQKKKLHSTCDSRPQGEWDRGAELMVIKFGESGHPVLRATSPSVLRNAQKHQYTSALMGERLKLFFAQFCQSAQYLRSSLRFV